MSGGVRNLRAMFENKDTSADPPDRGRSPAGSTGGASNGTSPRPLSKVRTSFVTVERSGQLGSQLGLKRETSGEPSLSKRRTSFSIDEEEHPKETADRKQSIAAEVEARKNSSVIEETIPEAAVETPTMTPTIEANKKLETSSRKKEVAKPAKGEDKKLAGPSQGHTNGTTKSAPVKHVEKPSTSKTVSKPASISTAKTATAAKPSPKKSPVKVPKTPTTPIRSHMKEAPAKTPERKPEKVDHKPEKKDARSSLASSHATKPASKPATTTAHGSAPKTRIPPSPPQTGFVKPRPRSPTRPIKLPASLTAHTASSGSKTAAAAPPASRQSLSRASGNVQPSNSLQAHHALARSPSRASATTTKSTLTRKPSTLKNTNPRPSLGPPPATLKKQTSRTSLPPHTAPADEGLLARMMRPTASSASKTADKLDATPPKRSQSGKRPVTRDGPAKNTTAHGSPAHKVKEASHAKAATKDVKPVVKKENAAVAPVVKKEEPEVAVEEEVPEAAEPLVEAETTQAEEVHEDQVEEVKDVEVEEVKPEEPVITEEVKEEPVEEAAAEVEEAAPVVEEPSTAPEPVKEEVPEISEPAPEEDVEVTAPAVEEPETSKEEPVVSEPIPSPTHTKTEEVEDPEDVKAREEIAKLNAEVLRAAAEDDDVE